MKWTHKVRIWKISKYAGKRGTTYRVRWVLEDRPTFTESFATIALADSFRSRLIAAMAAGEAFHLETGLPVSMERRTQNMTWFEFVCEYLDMKWPDWSPMHRKTTTESLMHVTLAMLRDGSGKPDGKVLRKTLRRCLNKNGRRVEQPVEIEAALRWLRNNTRNVGDLAEPGTLRSVLRALDRNLDGKKAAANTARLRRTALVSAIDYALERKLLLANPLSEVKTSKRKQTLREVDPHAVVNPSQARKLLSAVAEVSEQGPRLVAFFGLMYYAALRPEEVCNLRKQNLSLPEAGWGEIRLQGARPEVGKVWTDSGTASEERALKHRDDDAGRTVPCPPALTEFLHDHVNKFGTAADGRLFRGARDGGRIASTVYGRVWAKTREAVFAADEAAGPLAKRPYDLRHAAVSTWLTGGVEATRVAKWAGHSLAVLLRVYAKCLDGGEEAARARVDAALKGL